MINNLHPISSTIYLFNFGIYKTHHLPADMKSTSMKRRREQAVNS